MPGETVTGSTGGENRARAAGWESLADFNGERNINDATGKERTFSNFDLYPRMQGESNEEYGARLKHMNEMTSKYLEDEAKKEEEANAILGADGTRTAKYEASAFGKTEVNAEASYDALEAKVNQAVAEGRLSQDNANKILERKLNEVNKIIEGARQDYEDRKAVGTEEDNAAYEEYLKAHDEENMKNLGERKYYDDEEALLKLKLEEEEKRKLEEEEKRRLEEEERKKHEQGEDTQENKEEERLFAVNADFSKDRKVLAEREAKEALNKETSEAKGIKGIAINLWKGTLFKKYFQKKYERELLEGTRTVGEGEDAKTIDQIVAGRKEGALERFRLGINDDLDSIDGEKSRFIHEKAGESYSEADKGTTEFVKGTINEFLEETKKYEGKYSSKELKNLYDEIFRRKCQEAVDKGEAVDVDVNDYGNVALQALELSMHGAAMDKVMEGFKVYNAKVNDEVRTEEHRDAIDKIVNAFESNKIGQFIKPELIALAAGTAASLAQMGARSAASAAAPAVGGILVSSAISGLRERNRITEDRAQMMQNIANGLEYTAEGKSNRRARYEAKIGGTIYNISKATDLTKDLAKATEDYIKGLESGEGDENYSDNLLRAMADARVRIDFSDSEEKDLIAYSSADKRGNERLFLDMQLIMAEKNLTAADKEKYDLLKDEIQKEISGDVDKQDKKFANKRALMSVAKAGKTAALGAAFFFGSQEVMAAVDPTKIGVFEKIGLLKTTNTSDAKETLLASGFGLNRGTYSYDQFVEKNSVEVDADNQAEITRLQQDGYTSEVIKPASSYEKIDTKLIETSPAESKLAWDTKIDFWADNGTRIPDGNERSLFIEGGKMVAKMSGQSTGNGENFGIQQIVNNQDLKAFITVGGKRFEVLGNGAGEFGSGNGMFDVIGPDGTVGTIKALGDNGEPLYKYFEVVADRGVDADGVRHIVPLATATGSNSFDGLISQTNEVVTKVETPAVLRFTKDIFERVTNSREITGAGVAFAPDTARVGLGAATAPTTEASVAGETTPAGEPAPTTGGEAPTDGEAGTPAPTGEGAPITGGETPTKDFESLTEEEQEAIFIRDASSYAKMVDIATEMIGEEGRRILLNRNADGISAEEMSNWWNGLDEDGKNIVRRINKAREGISGKWANEYGVSAGFPYGVPFQNWLRDANNPGATAA